MMAGMERNQSVMNLPALNFLHEWVTQHTLKEDRAYIPWVQKVAEDAALAKSNREV